MYGLRSLPHQGYSLPYSSIYYSISDSEAELSSQVSDLQEANETAMSKLHLADEELNQLRLDNQRLKDSAASFRDSKFSTQEYDLLKAENSSLRDQVSSIRDHSPSAISGGMKYMQHEISQLRSDLRNLRDNNHQLTQDNIKLTEYIRDLEGVSEKDNIPSNKSKELLARADRFKKERDSALEEVDLLRERLRKTLEAKQIAYHHQSPSSSFTKESFKFADDDLADLDSASQLNSNQKHPDEPMHIGFTPGDERISPYTSSKPRMRSSSPINRGPEMINGSLEFLVSPGSAHTLTNKSLPPRKPSSHEGSLIDDIIDELPYLVSRTNKNIGVQNTREQHHHESELPEIVPPGHVAESPCSSLSTRKLLSSSADFEMVLDELTPPKQNIKTDSNSPKTTLSDLSSVKTADLFNPSHGAKGSSGESTSIRTRRASIESDSTDVLLTELNQQWDLTSSLCVTTSSANLPKLKKGTDPERMPPSPPGSPITSGPSETFRPFTEKPIATQHNKATLNSSDNSSKEMSFNTIGKVPFAPRSAQEISVGDIVKFCRQGGKISKGLVKYVGHLPGKNDIYLGVELELEVGKHDGTYEGQRYFQCKSKRGVFVAFSKVIMLYSNQAPLRE